MSRRCAAFNARRRRASKMATYFVGDLSRREILKISDARPAFGFNPFEKSGT
jgi:hypothetical protein